MLAAVNYLRLLFAFGTDGDPSKIRPSGTIGAALGEKTCVLVAIGSSAALSKC